METNLASAAAIRISQLWPTLNTEQLRLTTKALLSPEFDSIVVSNVISEMYMRNTHFFDLAELTKCVRQSKDAPDPLSQPNSYQSQTLNRRKSNLKWEQDAVSADRLKTWWGSLGQADRTDMIELFKQTSECAAMKDFYDVQFNKGRAPIPFLDWAHHEAGKSVSK